LIISDKIEINSKRNLFLLFRALLISKQTDASLKVQTIPYVVTHDHKFIIDTWIKLLCDWMCSQ